MNKYPKFIKGKISGISLRLVDELYSKNTAEYYRDGGEYPLFVQIKDGLIIGNSPMIGEPIEFEKCSYDYWRIDNGHYVPKNIKQ